MQDLIMKIIDIEDKAQKVIRDAKKADNELENKIAKDSEKLGSDIAERVRIKNAALQKLEEEEADKKIEAVNVALQKQLAELEEKYNKNKNVWIEEIVSGIIGR